MFKKLAPDPNSWSAYPEYYPQHTRLVSSWNQIISRNPKLLHANSSNSCSKMLATNSLLKTVKTLCLQQWMLFLNQLQRVAFLNGSATPKWAFATLCIPKLTKKDVSISVVNLALVPNFKSKYRFACFLNVQLKDLFFPLHGVFTLAWSIIAGARNCNFSGKCEHTCKLSHRCQWLCVCIFLQKKTGDQPSLHFLTARNSRPVGTPIFLLPDPHTKPIVFE